MKCWQKKVVVITDCNDEVGANVIDKLVKAGMIVIGFAKTDGIVHIATDKFKELASKKLDGKVVLCKCDITNLNQLRDAFDKIVQEYGGVDVLVNNAFYNADALVSTGNLEDFRKVVDVNIYGLIACTRLAATSMIDRKTRGHIININDLCVYQIPENPKKNVFIATKCAITSVTEILRIELRYLKANVKVTNIACGEQGREDEPSINIKDVAKLVKMILNTPEHLQVHEVVIDSTLL
jgi:NADP-dependent 3-hydroxy acid dehydrogenase YdfG